MAKQPKDAFAVNLSAQQKADIARRLVDELRIAKQASGEYIDDNGRLDFYWALYEQQSQRGISRNTPRYGSADLTSPIGTENVDALSARAVKTLFVEPVCIVEGMGQDSAKAPIVEAYLQWRQERMRLQQTAKIGITSALVETGAVLEVCEDAEPVICTEDIRAIPMKDEQGRTILDAETLSPSPTLDEKGRPVPSETDEYVQVKYQYEDLKRAGASVKLRSMKDFLVFPAHARHISDGWARAWRYWLSWTDVESRMERGEFDKSDDFAPVNDRQQSAEDARAGVTVQHNHGEDTIEKEIWRIQFWYNFGNGLQCYIADVSEQHDCLLRLRVDGLQRWRTVYLNPYPRPYSWRGYSIVGDKLLTTIEEHTAWRNMNADRATLKANAPIKRLHGSQWDPALQPFGAGAVIDVGSMNEVEPFAFEDVSAQSMNKEGQCVQDAQRIIGMNDIAIGQVSEKARTLGENEMATRESFTRTDDPIGNLQEGIEDLFGLIHAIEVQSLRDRDGVELPGSVTSRIHAHGFGGTVTADMLDGDFLFKPRGSVESADPNKRLNQMMNGIGWLLQLAPTNPMIAQRMQSPEMADALMQMFVTEFKPRDQAAFLQPIQPPAPPMLGPGLVPGDEGAPQDFGGQQLVDSLLQGMPQGGVQ